MCDTTHARLDVEEQPVRLARAREESEAFIAEQRKLMADAQNKILAEAQQRTVAGGKFRHERWLLMLSAFGGVAGFIAAAITAAQSLGWINP